MKCLRCSSLLLLTAVTVLMALPVLGQDATGEIAVESEWIDPDGKFYLEDLAEPVPPPADLEALRAALDDVNKVIPVPSSGLPPVGPDPGTETAGPGGAKASTGPAVYLVRDTVFSELNGTGAAFSSVTEMSGANDGKYVFATGNWWAGRSTDQGLNWTYFNPYTFANFCCDQDVVYEPTYDMFIWFRQAVVSGSQNQINFAVSINDGTGFFCSYTLTSTSGEWYDYPHLAVTNTRLILTSNVFSTPGDSYLRSTVWSYPLAPMSTCSSLSGSTFSDTSGTMTPAQGGTTYAYIGQHRNTSTLRVYRWLDGAGSIQTFDRTVPTWNQNVHSCPGPDGNDMCARSGTDNRITAGYVRRHPQLAFSPLETVSFFWNVGADGSFPKPYVDNAWFYTNTMALGGREYLWSSTTAFHYAAAAPNREGASGIVVSANSSTTHPQLGYCKDDYTDGTPPGWGCTYPAAAAGNQGPPDDNWGDYNRVRCFEPRCTCWMATGHVRKSGSSHPIYAVFGNGADYQGCFNDWFAQP